MSPTNYTPADRLTECLVLSPTLSSHEGCFQGRTTFSLFPVSSSLSQSATTPPSHAHGEEERADNHNPRAKHPCSVPSNAGFGNPPCSGHVRASADVATDRQQKRSRSTPPQRKIASGLSRSPGWADGISRRECCPRPAGGLVLAAQQCFGHEAVGQRQSLGFQNRVRRESQRASRAHGCAI